jgi:thiamine-monophosphate kinase
MNLSSGAGESEATATYSDEPTRVNNIVSRFFSHQSGTDLTRIGSTTISLAVGADQKDDCAVIDVSGPVSLVFGTDYVRGPKFALYERGLLNNYDIGYYLVVANISDIAAMGAAPLAVATVVRYPKTMSDRDFEAIVAGIDDAARACGAVNVGGDIGGAERIILSASALGACAPGCALTRSGARAGDLLCVTGPAGTAGAAVAYFVDESFTSRLSPDVEAALLAAWKRPVARTIEGGILGRQKLATACQDTSDGLKATVEQLAAASGVGFVIERDSLPIDQPTAEVASLIAADSVALALSASVDFQLAFTIGPTMLARCEDEFSRADRRLHVIGNATEDRSVTLRDLDGELRPLPGVTWRHQEGDVAKLATRSTG